MLVSPVLWGAEPFVSTINPPQILPGERTLLEIRAPAPAHEPIEPVIHDELLTQAKNLKVLSKDFQNQDGQLIWRYALTAYDSGRLRIPPVEIVVGPQSFSSENLILQVNPHRKDGDNELRPEYGAVPEPFRWRLFLKWLAGAILLFYAVKLLRKYLPPLKRSLKARPRAETIATPLESDEEWLRRHLRQLRQKLNSEPDSQQVDEFTRIVRVYFSRREKRPVLAWTTSEISSKLSQNAERATTISWLKNCDEIKFNGNSSLRSSDLLLSILDDTERILTKSCGI